jgi:excisionase family DNA binding protein
MNGNHLQAVPTVDELLQNVETAIKTVSAAEAPIILGTLERLKAVVWSRMLAAPRPEVRATGKENLTAQDVAPILNVKPSMVYELVRTKRLKAYKVGKYIRFKESAIQDFLAQGGA